MRAKFVWVLFNLLFLLESVSFASRSGRTIEYSALPLDWQPLISFYQAGEATGSGVLFVETENDENRGIARIKQIHVLDDTKINGHSAYVETDVLSLAELQAAGGYPLIVRSGYNVITLKGSGVSDQGGLVRIRLLKDATNIFSDKYNEKLVFNVAVKGMKVTATRNGQEFNLLGVLPRKATVPGKGRISVGVEKVLFCDKSCSNPGSDFSP